ncbi:MAG: UDP-N-acetylglucosamine 2-epimerase [Candidatus Methanoperedens sp.]|nr:UDP-N-acetylglucosamine 2-epimerase [Candidatus Methanoperedens sp.]
MQKKDMIMNLSIILATRPEIIKLAPVIRECERMDLDFFISHTGQHYSFNMGRIFFEQLELLEAKYNLEVGSGEHCEQKGRMMAGNREGTYPKLTNEEMIKEVDGILKENYVSLSYIPLAFRQIFRRKGLDEFRKF